MFFYLQLLDDFFGPMFGTIAFLPKKTIKIAIIHNLTPHEKRFLISLSTGFLNSFDGAIVLSDFVLKDLQKINSKIPLPNYSSSNI